MSEEVKEPSIVIPRAMIGTILVNGVLGFGMIIALLFCMGDINEVLQSPVSLAGYVSSIDIIPVVGTRRGFFRGPELIYLIIFAAIHSNLLQRHPVARGYQRHDVRLSGHCNHGTFWVDGRMLQNDVGFCS